MLREPVFDCVGRIGVYNVTLPLEGGTNFAEWGALVGSGDMRGVFDYGHPGFVFNDARDGR